MVKAWDDGMLNVYFDNENREKLAGYRGKAEKHNALFDTLIVKA